MADFSRIANLNPADARLAGLIFEYVQVLLDDDANLTPAGNLTSGARQLLRTRLEELIAAEQAGGAVAGAIGSPSLFTQIEDAPAGDAAGPASSPETAEGS